jgi:hypothetical protein
MLCPTFTRYYIDSVKYGDIDMYWISNVSTQAVAPYLNEPFGFGAHQQARTFHIHNASYFGGFIY